MGQLTEPEFQAEVDNVKEGLTHQLGNKINHFHFGKIYYQDILQDKQSEVFTAMQNENKLDWLDLRQFILFGFSDAASLEYRAILPGSEYEQAQERILAALDEAYHQMTTPIQPVVILAQSLGSHLISNYLWDSQQARTSGGIWSGDRQHGVAKGSAQDNFRRLKTLKVLYTTGCNIPLFVAGKRPIQAVKTRTEGYDFTWYNYYDRDDVLGWPLRPLGHFFGTSEFGTVYSEAVTEDIELNVNAGLTDWLTESWNPLSHRHYWEDAEIIAALASHLDQLLSAAG